MIVETLLILGTLFLGAAAIWSGRQLNKTQDVLYILPFIYSFGGLLALFFLWIFFEFICYDCN